MSDFKRTDVAKYDMRFLLICVLTGSKGNFNERVGSKGRGLVWK